MMMNAIKRWMPDETDDKSATDAASERECE